MSRRRRISAAIALTAIVATAVTAVSVAQTGGFRGLFNARGTIQPVTIRDQYNGVKIRLREPTDVAIVAAQIDPDGQTGWHTHPADSIAVVQPLNPTMTMLTYRHGHCRKTEFKPGEAFVHPAGPHNFVNRDTDTPLNFGVAYFAPVGSQLLTTAPAPPGCHV